MNPARPRPTWADVIARFPWTFVRGQRCYWFTNDGLAGYKRQGILLEVRNGRGKWKWASINMSLN